MTNNRTTAPAKLAYCEHSFSGPCISCTPVKELEESHDQESSAFVPFDAYEVHGVREYTENGEKFCEQVDDNEASFWSVYGHIPGHGLLCIGDFTTRQDAEEIMARITGR